MARSSPGNIDATNNVPTDIARRSAIITSIIEGGIKIPSVPEAAIVPVDRDLS